MLDALHDFLVWLRVDLVRAKVTVHLLGARDLKNADEGYTWDGRKQLSDPYAVVHVGRRHHRTKNMDNNLNPEWRQKFHFEGRGLTNLPLEIEVFDEDTVRSGATGTKECRHVEPSSHPRSPSNPADRVIRL